MESKNIKEKCLKYITFLEKNPSILPIFDKKTLTNNPNQLVLTVPKSTMLHYTLCQSFEIPLLISYTVHLNSDQGFLQALVYFINNYLDFSEIDKRYSSYMNSYEATINLMNKIIKEINVCLSTKNDQGKEY